MKTSFDCVRSIRYAGVVIMISAISAVQACSSDTIPTAPHTITRESVAELSQLRVSGTVTDEDGAPVSGVIVSVSRWTTNGQSLSTAVTDRSGLYSLSLLSAPGITAFTVKEGYVSAWHSDQITRGTDFQWDFRIYRVPKPAD